MQTEGLCGHADCPETALGFSGRTVRTGLSARINWDWLSFHEGIKFPSVCLVNYFLACADRPDHTETCGFSCLPLLALTRLASVLQNGLQGGSDSIVFRLLDEAGLSVTVRQHFMIFFQGDILGNFRNQPVESQRSLCCCFGAEDSSSLSSPGCGHMSVPCREDAFFAYSPFTHPCLSLHFLSFLCFFFFSSSAFELQHETEITLCFSASRQVWDGAELLCPWYPLAGSVSTLFIRNWLTSYLVSLMRS